MTTTNPPEPKIRRGDVVLVLFPHSDLRTAKRRPALIVQNDDLQTDLEQVIVAMITSKVFRANAPSRILVEIASPEGEQSGLLTDSVIVTDNLATITRRAIAQTIGHMPMTRVDEALRHTLGL